MSSMRQKARRSNILRKARRQSTILGQTRTSLVKPKHMECEIMIMSLRQWCLPIDFVIYIKLIFLGVIFIYMVIYHTVILH